MNPPSPALRRELLGFAGGLAASLAAGVLLGRPALVASVFLALYGLWQILRLDALARWLAGGAKAAKAPPTIGLGDRIVELVHREKKYSRKQKQRYKNALAQFNGLAAELPDAIVVLDALMQIRWANTAAHALLRVQPERDRGQRIDNLVREPAFREMLVDGDGGAEVEIELPGGSGRTLATRLVPSVNGMSLLVARDVTQRVRLREMRKAFVGDVSHELRTPLTVIEGYLELLCDEPALEPRVRAALEQVAMQSSRMRNIVENLLQLSRLEGEPLGEGEGETVAVGALLRAMVQAIADTPSAGERARFTLEIDDTLGLLGSESEFWSACNNLLTNAVKYAAGARVEVGWGLDAEGQPTVSVRDEGPGIEARHLPRLSERFYRVDAARSRDSGGTGLGLAIVKHAAQHHGGQLLIDSVPGQGSLFRIAFPPGRAIALRNAASA